MNLVGPSQSAFDAAPPEMGPPSPRSVDDFIAYLPQHTYIFRATREIWKPESVNACVPPIMVGNDAVPANRWLDRNRAVHQITWMPGKPEILEDTVVAQGGVTEHPGVRAFNLYMPPAVVPGNAREAGRWRDHLRRLYPEDAEHVERWLAHRIQRPGEKVNHAIVLAGDQGIGKDTLLEPVKLAVGHWNWQEVTPSALMGRFNGFAKAVVLRISEVRDLGDVDRYAFYEHTKIYAAAPPDVLRVDEKNLREHYVPNVSGLLMTTNHTTTGLFLPADDRRHFVAASSADKADFGEEFFLLFWAWYEAGGHGHVAEFLRTLDLTAFDPKAPPPKTAAWKEIVMANTAAEEGELAELLETIGRPPAITVQQVRDSASGRQMNGLLDFLNDRRTARAIPHRFGDCGYKAIPNPDRKDGLWPVGIRRTPVYARRELTPRDQIAAARELAREPIGGSRG